MEFKTLALVLVLAPFSKEFFILSDRFLFFLLFMLVELKISRQKWNKKFYFPCAWPINQKLNQNRKDRIASEENKFGMDALHAGTEVTVLHKKKKEIFFRIKLCFLQLTNSLKNHLRWCTVRAICNAFQKRRTSRRRSKKWRGNYRDPRGEIGLKRWGKNCTCH